MTQATSLIVSDDATFIAMGSAMISVAIDATEAARDAIDEGNHAGADALGDALTYLQEALESMKP